MTFTLPKPGEKWKRVPLALATPETPLWMIERGSDKRLTWEWQGKKRILQEGPCAPFDSFSELLALVKFLDGNSDFGIHYGRYQAEVRPENLTELPNFGVQFSFDNLPGEPAAKRVHDDVRQLKSLWISQLPFYPIPPPYRNWLKSSAKLPATEIPFSRTDPRYARQVVERFVPDAKLRRALLELLASLIEEANASPQNWGVTLYPRGLALNVGGGYYCAFLTPDELKLFWKGSANPEPPGTGPQFTRIPDSHSASGPVATALTWLLAIRPQMSELIKFTNEKSNRLLGNARQAHSSGVLRYVEEELGITLPDPVYPEAPSTGTVDDLPVDNSDDKIVISTSKPLPNVPLNTILYGPPGTGKTYRASRSAVEIIEGDVPANYKALRTRYAQLQKEGRIEFVTFHQSYSYEDFIEGLRPVINDDSEDQNTRYEIRPGILKTIATEAFCALLEPVNSPPAGAASDDATLSFDDLWNSFLDHIESEPDKEYSVHVGVKYLMRCTKGSGVEGINVATDHSNWSYVCGKSTARKVWVMLSDQKNVTLHDVKAVLKVGAKYRFIATIVNELQQIRNDLQTPTSADRRTVELSAADKEERVLDYLSDGVASGYQISGNSDFWPRYVLIIDEINRGNISKILGELITLLEDDKRLGADNELIVTLPYSRQKFALPPNLYIVGTMNTADKSIALVDIALRRRFEFEELRPDFSSDVCTGLSEDMRSVLVELNRRISLRKDRDHRIGHAYFIKVHDENGFNRIVERKIVPLLGEYFYGDWEGLRWVLNEKDKPGSGFVQRISGSDDRAVRNHWQWYVDAENDDDFNPLATLAANLLPASAG